MRRSRRAIAAAAMAALTAGVLATSIPGAPTSATEPVPGQPYFRRVATAYADENAGGIAAEIIASAQCGNTLITPDSPRGLVALWDIPNTPARGPGSSSAVESSPPPVTLARDLPDPNVLLPDLPNMVSVRFGCTAGTVGHDRLEPRSGHSAIWPGTSWLLAPRPGAKTNPSAQAA